MTNILTITLGSFKLDVPLDSLTKLSATPAAAKPAAAIIEAKAKAKAKIKAKAQMKKPVAAKPEVKPADPIKQAEAPTVATPVQPSLPVVTPYNPPAPAQRKSRIAAIKQPSFYTLAVSTIRSLAVGSSAFLPHTNKHVAQVLTLSAARDLRFSNFYCVITTRQVEENGMPGLRIWRLR